MKVHNTLGNGFQEVIYQRALELEFINNGFNFEREHSMFIYYDGIHIGNRRVDFFIENKIMLEIKACTQIEKQHLTQAINYCEVAKVAVGLLINFGHTSLEYKRVYNKNHLDN